MSDDLAKILQWLQQRTPCSILHSRDSSDVTMVRGIQNYDSAYSVRLTLSKFAREDFPALHEFEHVTDWIAECEIFFDKHKTSDDNKVFLASHYLNDQVKVWFNKGKKEYSLLSWTDFSSLLVSVFVLPYCNSDTFEKAIEVDDGEQKLVASLLFPSVQQKSLNDICLIELCCHEEDDVDASYGILESINEENELIANLNHLEHNQNDVKLQLDMSMSGSFLKFDCSLDCSFGQIETKEEDLSDSCDLGNKLAIAKMLYFEGPSSFEMVRIEQSQDSSYVEVSNDRDVMLEKIINVVKPLQEIKGHGILYSSDKVMSLFKLHEANFVDRSPPKPPWQIQFEKHEKRERVHFLVNSMNQMQLLIIWNLTGLAFITIEEDQDVDMLDTTTVLSTVIPERLLSMNKQHFVQMLWDPGGWMEKYGVLAVFPDSPWPLQSFCIFNSTQIQNEDRFLNLERKVELILLHIHELEALSLVTYSSLFKLLQILESALSLQLDYFLDDLISWNILLEVSYSNKMLAFDPALVKEYFDNWWDKEQSTINCKRNRGEQRNDRDVFLQRSAKEFITMMGPRPHGLCFGMDVLSVFYLDIRKKQARLASLSFEDGVISYFDRLSLYHNAWTELFEKDHFTFNVSQSVGCSQILQQITACSTIRASSSSRQGIETQVLEIVECCHCSNELDMLNSTNILQDIYHLAINCMVLLQIFHKLREYKNQEGFLDFMDVHRKALVLGKFVMCGMLISSNIVLVNDFIDPSRVLSARRLVKGLNKDDMVYDNILLYMNQFCNYLSGKLDLISELKRNLMCQELVVSLMEEEEYRLKEFSNEVIKVFDNKLSTVRDLIFLCNRTWNFGEGQCITSNTGRLKIRGLYYFHAKKFAHNVVMGDQNKGHGYIVWDPGGMD